MRSWVIGNSPECDVVVDSPLASARHCQLTQTPEGYFLNDLGSTNGTYVNGVRIAVPIRLTLRDSITLGRTVPFPWPPELTTSIRIGRLADNDIVLDDARVSGHHARLIVVAGFQTFIEDSGSSNGTFLNSADRRVTTPTPVTELDSLYFGTLAVPAARLLAGLKEPATVAVRPPPPPAPFKEQQRGPTAALAALAIWEENRWLLAWLAQVPTFAVLIVLILGRQTAAATWESVGHGIAATTFALALAALWLGCSLAVAAVAAPRSALPVGKRLAILASLCPVACAVLLPGVYWGVGLTGPWPAMWGVLVMTSLVGFFLGLVVSNPVRNSAAAASVLLICFVAMIALGGWIWPLPKMSAPVQLFAEAMPSRWAFEGLILLEADQHRAIAAPDETDPSQTHDPVEEYFPVDSERMGITADAITLGSMLIGLVALTLFISGLSRPDP
jgi:pSer/pThr/pTyr-binding forkhead associated (FHA) protein